MSPGVCTFRAGEFVFCGRAVGTGFAIHQLDRLPPAIRMARARLPGTVIGGRDLIEHRQVDGGERSAEMRWLDRFHDGDRAALTEVYWEHFAAIDAALAHIVDGVDRETVVYDLFQRLLHQESLRRSFKGGDLRGWLITVACQRAVDYLHQRQAVAENPGVEGDGLVECFRRQVLPPDWQGVFQARFLVRMSRAEAAAAVGISRAAVIYQELRICRLLRRFLLDNRASGLG